jgi:hypothetical protein
MLINHGVRGLYTYIEISPILAIIENSPWATKARVIGMGILINHRE